MKSTRHVSRDKILGKGKKKAFDSNKNVSVTDERNFIYLAAKYQRQQKSHCQLGVAEKYDVQ